MSFFEQTPTVSRLLYNQDFVAAGCPKEGYDEDFEVDDTVGTWITNFIIFLFGLVAFIKFGSYGCASAPYSKQISALLPYFILNVSLAFLVAAIGHIIVDQRSDKIKYKEACRSTHNTDFMYMLGGTTLKNIDHNKGGTM